MLISMSELSKRERENKAKTGRADLSSVKPFTVYLTPEQIEKLERMKAAEARRQGRAEIKTSDYMRWLIDNLPVNVGGLLNK